MKPVLIDVRFPCVGTRTTDVSAGTFLGFWASFCGRSIPISRSLQGRKIFKIEKASQVPPVFFPGIASLLSQPVASVRTRADESRSRSAPRLDDPRSGRGLPGIALTHQRRRRRADWRVVRGAIAPRMAGGNALPAEFDRVAEMPAGETGVAEFLERDPAERRCESRDCRGRRRVRTAGRRVRPPGLRPSRSPDPPRNRARSPGPPWDEPARSRSLRPAPGESIRASAAVAGTVAGPLAAPVVRGAFCRHPAVPSRSSRSRLSSGMNLSCKNHAIPMTLIGFVPACKRSPGRHWRFGLHRERRGAARGRPFGVTLIIRRAERPSGAQGLVSEGRRPYSIPNVALPRILVLLTWVTLRISAPPLRNVMPSAN